MARTKRGQLPQYCLHKQSNIGYATLDGGQFLFDGDFGSKASREHYDRTIAEWLANGRRLPHEEIDGITIAELVERYKEHAKVYYRRVDGSETHEIVNIKYTAMALTQLYGSLAVSEFGIAKLKVLRETMVAGGLARSTINDRCARVVRIVKWGVQEQLVPPAVYGELRALDPLKRGRSEAKETEPRQPVSEADMRAVLPHLTPTLQAIVLFMWHTAARCCEATQIRSRDVDMSHGTWTYEPPQHKNAHRGQSRPINIGPRCQEALRPFVRLAPDTPWFSPEQAMREHLDARRRDRKTKLFDSHVRHMEAKRVASRKRPPGELFTTLAVGRAVSRACTRAGVSKWTPHQLRHAALTRIRIARGADAAVAVGGHSSREMTDHYTRQAQRELAIRIAADLG